MARCLKGLMVGCTILLLAQAPAWPADPPLAALSEGFEDITQLPARGWVLVNQSEPTGDDWFQGNDTFAAQSGAANSYIAANVESVAGVGLGTISNWLMTPELMLESGTRIRFWTRTRTPFPGDAPFPDRLQLRLSLDGASVDVGGSAFSVGSFTQSLIEINPALSDQYPITWTLFEYTLESIPPSTTGRFAFRYFVTESGFAGDNGDFIGIDTVSVTSPTAPQDDLIFSDRFED